MVDASHEEIVIEEDDFRATNTQLDLARDKNKTQPNSKIILVTQLVSTSITIGRHVDEAVQLNLT
jgi:hypothetical protein